MENKLYELLKSLSSMLSVHTDNDQNIIIKIEKQKAVNIGAIKAPVTKSDITGKVSSTEQKPKKEPSKNGDLKENVTFDKEKPVKEEEKVKYPNDPFVVDENLSDRDQMEGDYDTW